MANDSYPADRHYTKDHEWAQKDGARVVVGITSFAVDQLGDVTLVSLDVKVGDELDAGEAFGTIESVKTLSDLYAPLGGKVVAINSTLDSEPELVNADPWTRGWMIALEPSAPDVTGLMDAAAYAAHVASSDH